MKIRNKKLPRFKLAKLSAEQRNEIEKILSEYMGEDHHSSDIKIDTDTFNSNLSTDQPVEKSLLSDLWQTILDYFKWGYGALLLSFVLYGMYALAKKDKQYLFFPGELLLLFLSFRAVNLAAKQKVEIQRLKDQILTAQTLNERIGRVEGAVIETTLTTHLVSSVVVLFFKDLIGLNHMESESERRS
jgi:uncharacterized membrane protein